MIAGTPQASGRQARAAPMRWARSRNSGWIR
ncbi:Uncharacterised protein [Bordetella pertussis]|nr:Uncharacterised protein [Bordetella pertussis]